MSAHELQPNCLYVSYEITESPETGRNIPVVISWWHHPDPTDADAQAGTRNYKGFIRQTRMHEQMAHHLSLNGERTCLSLQGRSGRILNHPLSAALQEAEEMPLPDPVPADFGHAVVSSDMGMYVLLAAPQLRVPTFADLTRLAYKDLGAVGMARLALEADDEARRHYAVDPEQAAINRVLAEPDEALRSALTFTLGIRHPGGWG
ncbi:hypothetical protein [Streptomyces sp. NPDC059761]|uniref:hypothetical protein n=1 Tax=Streptomyces sp. NPDC059761 TaxID=3346937 RepID=UPI003658C4BB